MAGKNGANECKKDRNRKKRETEIGKRKKSRG